MQVQPSAEILICGYGRSPNIQMSLDETQNLIPNLLLTILSSVWRDRQDWFFGVNTGICTLDLLAEQEQSKQINYSKHDHHPAQSHQSAQKISLEKSDCSDRFNDPDQADDTGDRHDVKQPVRKSGSEFRHNPNQESQPLIIANGLLSLGVPRYQERKWAQWLYDQI
jgi:hypothetical protein